MTPRPAPRIVLLLPVAVFLHQLEEWFGGFVPWAREVLGFGITPEQFLTINAFGLLLFASGCVAAAYFPGAAWFAASVAALMGINGVAHIALSLVYGSYSAGAVTGLLLFIPLSFVVLRALAKQLDRSAFVGAVLVGILIHALATFTALG